MQKTTLTKEAVMRSLRTVKDPELNISIVDLGLVYSVTITKQLVTIVMTLTTIGCPLFPLIEQDVQNTLYKKGVKKAKISLTFDPPWSMSMMSKSAKAQLGIL